MALGGQQLLYERRVDDTAAGIDPPERIDEIRLPEQAGLQQVANTVALLQQVDGCLDLNMGRKEENPDIRELQPNRRAASRPSQVCVGGMRISSTTRAGA